MRKLPGLVLLASVSFAAAQQSQPRVATPRDGGVSEVLQTFTVTDIQLGEPDPKLFELPAGYTTVDLRKHTAPAD